MDQLRVMIVDDDPEMCGFLQSLLSTQGYSALAVTTGDEAVRRFHAERPDAVLLDIVMPGGMDGMATLAALKDIDRDVPVIVISGHGRASTIVEAMKLGASNFACKPFEDIELQVLLSHALKERRLSRDGAVPRDDLQGQSQYAMLFGHSASMLAVRDLIEHVAETDVAILILGESGTGKELVARALHERSLRRDKPFIKVNCAALPAELLESELFGFEKGAFTGALQQKPGRFEAADHGTIFLDEIGDMEAPLQAKLLQVLQDGEFSRLGGKGDVRVDARVVAATNHDLEAAVAEGRFRQDLYFRLNVVPVTLPPLRDRREDIPLLAEHFLTKFAMEFNRPTTGLSAAVAQAFFEYDWPGNVRQLENMIKRRVVLGSEASLLAELQHAGAGTQPSDVAPAGAPIAPAVGAQVSLKDISRSAARGAERKLILDALTRTHWNRKEAAEILGISYKAMLYKIKDDGLDKPS